MTETQEANPLRDQHRFIGRLRPKTLTIFDVGANRGQSYARYRRAFPGSQIYCFEPFPESVANLRAATVGDPRAHVIDMAVAESSGTRTFHVNGKNPTNSLLPRPTGGRRYYPEAAGPVTTITVQATTLDDFVAAQNVGQVDILKFDVQGAEVLALQGADTLLRSGTVHMVFAEAMFVPHYENQPLLKDVWAFLEPYGYTLYNLYGLRCASNGQLRFGDALFVSDSLRRTVVDVGPDEG